MRVREGDITCSYRHDLRVVLADFFLNCKMHVCSRDRAPCSDNFPFAELCKSGESFAGTKEQTFSYTTSASKTQLKTCTLHRRVLAAATLNVRALTDGASVQCISPFENFHSHSVGTFFFLVRLFVRKYRPLAAGFKTLSPRTLPKVGR